MSLRFPAFGIGCISLLALASSLVGQSDRGTITGLVTDPTGAVVGEAKITAVNVDTNAASTTTTTQTGNYTLPALIIGRYRVSAEAAGFKRGIRDNVVISAGSTVRLDVSLELGSVSDSIEVNATATPLDTETTRVGTNITNKLVDELPFVVAGQIRNVFNLTTLAPEVKSASNFRIGGGQGAGWEMVMDGAAVTVASAAKQVGRAQITAVPVDAISEFTVESGGMKAEFGRSSGIINFATKSGTDQFHGNAFEYLRNDAFDARGFFAATKSKLRQHDFGATLGGPVIIPKIYNGTSKTFFFLSYEGFRNREGSKPNYYTIPLPEMYQGDFRGWTRSGKMVQLYDPATTRPNPSGSGFIRDPFQNNQVPVSQFSKVSSKYIALRPKQMVPNVPGPTLNYFVQSGSMRYPWDKGTARMDHQLGSKDTLTFFFMKGENADTAGAEGVPGMPYPYEQGPALWTRKQTYGKFSWNRLITPRTVNFLRYTKMKNMAFVYTSTATHPENKWGAQLGVKNVAGPDRSIPRIQMTDYQDWAGRSDTNWGRDDGWDWSIGDDLSHVAGSHTFKGGIAYSRDDWAGGGQSADNGEYAFTQLATAIPGDQSKNTGNAFASMLLGYVSSPHLETPRRQVFYWRHLGGYFQDDWRVNSKLSLNLGFRYDYTFPLTGGGATTLFKDAYDTLGSPLPGLEWGYSNFDPTVPNPGAGGLPGAMIFTGTGPGRTGSKDAFPAWKKAFQPRFGAAYSVRSGTVLRMSGGRTFQDLKAQGGTAHYDGFIGSLTWNSSDLEVRDFPMMFDAGMPAWNAPPYLQPDVMNRQNVNWWDTQTAGRPAEFWSWNFDVQQQIAATTVFTARYSGSRGLRLTSGLLRPNQISPSYLTTLGPTLLRANIASAAAQAAGIKSPYVGFSGTVQESLQRFPQYKTISVGLEHDGDSTYNALVLILDRRFASGLTLLGSYALSKMFTNADAVTGGNAAIDSYNLRLEKGLSNDDQTHSIRWSLSYDVPFGRGRKFLNSGVASHVLGGWSFAGTGEYSSGTPMAVASGFTVPTGGGNRVFITSYDNWRAPISGGSFDPFKDTWWNKSAFNQMPQSVLDTGLGNSTRNNPKARSPWTLNENVSLARNIKLKEQMQLTFRFEAFNLFNRVAWGAPTNSVTSATFGLVRSQANTPRQMQMALKLTF